MSQPELSLRDPFAEAETVLEVEDLVKHFPITQASSSSARSVLSRRSTGSASGCAEARPWASWESLAAASPPWPSC